MDEFPRHNISPSDLSEIRHFPFHHMVIRQILRGNYDAGVVKDRVAKEFTDKGIRILALSGPIPGSPIVAGPDSDPAVIEAFTQTLLSISPEDSVLKQWDPEFSFGFVKAENKDYDVLEKLIRQGGKK
jgi:phosphonate transport system substrate-binding protein